MLLKSRHHYAQLFQRLNELDDPVTQIRLLCQHDLFFLMRYALGRKDMENDWLFDRCREVQAKPDDMLDLWAREHYKSSIITFGLTIQEILNDPEITIGLFSHTRPIAKAFLRQIKREFEQNVNLKSWFSDILYEKPEKQAVKWSEDDGIIVKRKSNPKEATIEAWGVVDGQPTSKHYSLLIYDDLVTKESVTTPEMIEKTTDSLALSYNLGAHGGRRRFIGTRYHFADTYKTIMDRGTVTPRIHTATIDGSLSGEPVFLTQEQIDNKIRDFGPYVFSCFASDTRVLMGDMLEKNISDINIGDIVVGYDYGDGKRARLVKSKVICTHNQKKEAVRFTFESGRTIVSTKDHKFWSGRVERGYSPLGFGYGEIKSACTIYDPRRCNINDIPDKVIGYLAGVFDGEGSVSGNCIHIAQNNVINKKVCEAIEKSLELANLPFSIHQPPTKSNINDYYITGGRQEKIRFARIMKGFGKHERISEMVFTNGTRNIGKGSKDKLLSIDSVGIIDVYNIQTETGNYVAEGYAVKNCQMLQNPIADSAQGFKREWLRHYHSEPPTGCNWYILVDPANGKRKSNDYTTMWAVGLSQDGNMYAIPEVRDRLNVGERAARLITLHRKYKPVEVRYEAYGIQCDIAYIKKVMDDQNYRFDIIEVAGPTSKIDRVKRLVPLYQNGKIYHPARNLVTDYEGKTRDLVHDYIESEYVPFPVPLHDDMLDGLARIQETEGKNSSSDKKIPLTLQWPEEIDRNFIRTKPADLIRGHDPLARRL